MYVLYSKVLDLYIGLDKHRNVTLVKHQDAAIVYPSGEWAHRAAAQMVPSTHHLFETKEIE